MALRLSSRRLAAFAARHESCSASNSVRSSLRLQCRNYTPLQRSSIGAAPVATKHNAQGQRQTLDVVRGRRNFSVTAAFAHGHVHAPKPGEELHVTFIEKDGQEVTFEVAEGDNLLDIAQANDIEMEGACGGSCACSTCHVIVEDEAIYDKMEEPDDDENDMLDLAFGLTETSRLGCQIKMSKDLDGLRVKLPSMTRNLQASDFGKK